MVIEMTNNPMIVPAPILTKVDSNFKPIVNTLPRTKIFSCFGRYRNTAEDLMDDFTSYYWELKNSNTQIDRFDLALQIEKKIIPAVLYYCLSLESAINHYSYIYHPISAIDFSILQQKLSQAQFSGFIQYLVFNGLLPSDLAQKKIQNGDYLKKFHQTALNITKKIKILFEFLERHECFGSDFKIENVDNLFKLRNQIAHSAPFERSDEIPPFHNESLNLLNHLLLIHDPSYISQTTIDEMLKKTQESLDQLTSIFRSCFDFENALLYLPMNFCFEHIDNYQLGSPFIQLKKKPLDISFENNIQFFKDMEDKLRDLDVLLPINELKYRAFETLSILMDDGTLIKLE